MKSPLNFFFRSAASYLLAVGMAAGQHAAAAVTLGDPIPVSDNDPNIVQVSGSSCGRGCVKLDFQACDKGCGGCKETVVTLPCPCERAPACSIAARPAPCKACELPKFFQRASGCHACVQPAPAACAPCAKAPAACAPCEAKPIHRPAPACAPCAAKAPTCAPAPACAACGPVDPCQTPKHSRPVLDLLGKLFSNGGHHQAAAASCSTCTTCTPAPAAPPASPPIPTAIPASLATPDAAPVPAALAPYAPRSAR